MNALHNPDNFNAIKPKTRRHRDRPLHQAILTEITIKLIVNSILSLAAITALVKLLPYQVAQQAKLQEIRWELEAAEKRVDRLRDNFNRNFDPNQAKKVMQEQSSRISPNQRRVFWTK